MHTSKVPARKTGMSEQPRRRLLHPQQREDVMPHKQMKQETAERKLMSSNLELCHCGVLKSSS